MSNRVQDQFSARVRAAIEECHSLGYHPTRFQQMLEESDAVSVAKRMVVSGELQDGLRRLKSMNRLDLSVESIMLESEFVGLFSPQERAAAQWRLDQL